MRFWLDSLEQWFADKVVVSSESRRRDAIISVICKRGCG